MKCPIERICFLHAERRFDWHLAVFAAFGKGVNAQRFCENARREAAFDAIRPMA
jgi:hypothetical protein